MLGKHFAYFHRSHNWKFSSLRQAFIFYKRCSVSVHAIDGWWTHWILVCICAGFKLFPWGQGVPCSLSCILLCLGAWKGSLNWIGGISLVTLLLLGYSQCSSRIAPRELSQWRDCVGKWRERNREAAWMNFLKINFHWSVVDLNVMLVSAIAQSESVIHIHISVFF